MLQNNLQLVTRAAVRLLQAIRSCDGENLTMEKLTVSFLLLKEEDHCETSKESKVEKYV